MPSQSKASALERRCFEQDVEQQREVGHARALPPRQQRLGVLARAAVQGPLNLAVFTAACGAVDDHSLLGYCMPRIGPHVDDIYVYVCLLGCSGGLAQLMFQMEVADANM